MQKSEAVVIPMQINSKVTYILGNEKILINMKNLKALPIFSKTVEDFLACLSKNILKNPDIRQYSDVVTVGFWCRRSAIRRMARDYESDSASLGRGVVFHVAPSNVAVNFAYSLIAALLAGNSSIVRLPSKNFPQVGMLCHEIERSLQEVPDLRPYILLVRYGHDKMVNDLFSSICCTRVIWGGDKTIEEIRTSPLSARANEITFADRHAIALIHADQYLSAANKEMIAADFYNDTYLTDQNACSSPRIVIWLGDNVEQAKELFWQYLHRLVQDRYSLQAVQSVDKLTHIYRMSVAYPIEIRDMPDNYITRIDVPRLENALMDYKMNSGFFMEYHASDIEEILPLCTERCQTIACYGMDSEAVRRMIYLHGVSGVDRVVPFGQTMEFSLIWDGTDLIRTMSRKIEIVKNR